MTFADGFDEIVASPGAGPRNEARIGIYHPDGILLALSEPLANTHYGGQVAVGDIDGRGRRVAALSMADSESGYLTVILYGLDDGRNIVERGRVTLGVGSSNGSAARFPARVAFGDVNRDGRLELIAVTRSDLEVYGLDDELTISLLASRTTPVPPGSLAYEAPMPEWSKIIDTRREPPPVYLAAPPANYFRFRLGPEVTIAVGATVKRAGEQFVGEQIELLVAHEPAPEDVDPYEQLLGDAMRGEPFRFARRDHVEEAWRIVDPAIAAGTPVYEYEPGTWGPREAGAFIAPGA